MRFPLDPAIDEASETLEVPSNLPTISEGFGTFILSSLSLGKRINGKSLL